MKKTTLSLVSILALSGLAFAGGDIAPVEPVVETPDGCGTKSILSGNRNW